MLHKLILIIALVQSGFAFAQGTAEQTTVKRYADIVLKSSNKRKILTAQEMDRVLSHVITHPVASILDPANVTKYDPDGVIGFCFGRAMAVHLAARKIGLDQRSIRKVFIIGDMRSGPDPEWRFHVTTIVRGPEGKWYALDPIASFGPKPRVLTVSQWSQWVRSIWDRPQPGKVDFTKIYMVQPDFVIPNLLRVPEAGAQNQVDIMSTTFNPSVKPAYAPISTFAKDFYAVRFNEQMKQFIGVREQGYDRYNFTAIKVNGSDPYSYNNYFHDLLNVFAKTEEQDILNDASRRLLMNKRSLESQIQTERAVKRRNSLGSMRFGR